jgi:pimeloyl-ACP methyl ester carboxylesterase
MYPLIILERMKTAALFLTLAAALPAQPLLRIDHFVPVRSTVPAIAGQTAQIYLREVVRADAALRRAPLKVALFVHGAGTPAEVAFDVPYGDYSWMAFLAEAGYDVFSVDMTGYGPSTRPLPMNDLCNLSPQQQAQFIPQLLKAPCPPSYPHQMTTLASDWNDIDHAVDYLRALRGVDRVPLLAWSLGGPRAAGYAAQHPEKVSKLVLLAPAYNRNAPANPPAQVPAPGAAFGVQSRADFISGWQRQAPCPGQYESAALEAVWRAMLASDPVGATWGTGVRRAPNVTSWGWTKEAVAKTQIPTLLIAGLTDAQVPPDRVRELYADLGATQKVLLEMPCSSHNAMWEKDHLALFRASLEWLESTTVNGKSEGTQRVGQ